MGTGEMEIWGQVKYTPGRNKHENKIQLGTLGPKNGTSDAA